MVDRLAVEVQLAANPNVTGLQTVLRNINRQLVAAGQVPIQFNARQIQQATRQAQNLATSFGRAGVAINDVASAQRGIDQLNRSLARPASLMEDLGRQTAIVGRRFGVFLIASQGVRLLTSQLGSAVQESIRFNSELRRTAQLLSSGDIQLGGIGALDNNIRRTISGAATGLGVDPRELNQVVNTLAQAGRNISDIQQITRALSRGALTATFGDLGSSAENIEAILGQFRLGAGQTEQVLASLNTVTKSFNVSIEELFSGLRRAGTTFAEFSGVNDISRSIGDPQNLRNLQEFASVFTAIISTSRESAETVGTALRTILPRLQRSQTQDALQGFGIDLTENGQFVGAFEAFERISDALDDVDSRSGIISALTEEIGGLRQTNRVIPLIRNFAVAQRALNIQQLGPQTLDADVALGLEDLSVRLEQVRQSFLEVFRELSRTGTFDALADGLIAAANATTTLVRALSGLGPILPVVGGVLALRGIGTIGNIAGFARGFARNISNFNSGGTVGRQKLQNGGRAVALTPGEIVLTPEMVSRIPGGYNTLQRINDGGSANNLTLPGGVGVVPGSGNTDSVFTSLPDGSFVIRKSVSQKLLGQNVQRANSGGIIGGRQRFIEGGITGLNASLDRLLAAVSQRIDTLSREITTLTNRSQSELSRLRSAANLQGGSLTTSAVAGPERLIGPRQERFIGPQPFIGPRQEFIGPRRQQGVQIGRFDNLRRRVAGVGRGIGRRVVGALGSGGGLGATVTGAVLSQSSNPFARAGGGALSGAGTGAFLGSAFGPVGTAVGAAAGLFTGLISALKDNTRAVEDSENQRTLSRVSDAASVGSIFSSIGEGTLSQLRREQEILRRDANLSGADTLRNRVIRRQGVAAPIQQEITSRLESAVRSNDSEAITSIIRDLRANRDVASLVFGFNSADATSRDETNLRASVGNIDRLGEITLNRFISRAEGAINTLQQLSLDQLSVSFDRLNRSIINANLALDDLSFIGDESNRRIDSLASGGLFANNLRDIFSNGIVGRDASEVSSELDNVFNISGRNNFTNLLEGALRQGASLSSDDFLQDVVRRGGAATPETTLLDILEESIAATSPEVTDLVTGALASAFTQEQLRGPISAALDDLPEGLRRAADELSSDSSSLVSRFISQYNQITQEFIQRQQQINTAVVQNRGQFNRANQAGFQVDDARLAFQGGALTASQADLRQRNLTSTLLGGGSLNDFDIAGNVRQATDLRRRSLDGDAGANLEFQALIAALEQNANQTIRLSQVQEEIASLERARQGSRQLLQNVASGDPRAIARLNETLRSAQRIAAGQRVSSDQFGAVNQLRQQVGGSLTDDQFRSAFGVGRQQGDNNFFSLLAGRAGAFLGPQNAGLAGVLGQNALEGPASAQATELQNRLISTLERQESVLQTLAQIQEITNQDVSAANVERNNALIEGLRTVFNEQRDLDQNNPRQTIVEGSVQVVHNGLEVLQDLERKVQEAVNRAIANAGVPGVNTDPNGDGIQ